MYTHLRVTICVHTRSGLYFFCLLAYLRFLFKAKTGARFSMAAEVPLFPTPPPPPRCFKRKHQRGRRSRWMRGGVGGKDARRGGEAHGGAQGCSVGRETLCFPAILLRLSFPIQVRAAPRPPPAARRHRWRGKTPPTAAGLDGAGRG